MDRSLPDINLGSHSIDSWFFAPYMELDEYKPTDPLYGLIAEFEKMGDVMVYNRSGTTGTFHSVDPEHESVQYYPPTEEFKTAVAMVFNNPGEKKNLNSLIEGMYPWEHHQLELLVNGVNNDFESLPKEALAFINMILDEKNDIEVSDKEDAKKSEYLKLTKDIEEALMEKSY